MADVEKQGLVVIEAPSGGGSGGGSGCTILVVIILVLGVLGVGCYFLYVDVLEPIISPLKSAANAVSNPIGTLTNGAGNLIP